MISPITQSSTSIQHYVHSIGQKNKISEPKLGMSTFQSFVNPNMPNNYAYSLNSKSWVNSPNLRLAFLKLDEVRFDPYDVMYLENMGAKIRFKNGKEAVDFIKNKNISVNFAEVDNPKIHAQWTKSKNTIIINEKYRNTNDMAEILAISEAMIHEAGHALDDDYHSSIQEEIDCLALNTLANRFHQSKYSNVFKRSKGSAILDDGVCLYTKLFFDPDITKGALIKRVSEKYGELPVESDHHRAQILAFKVKEDYLNGGG